MDANGDRVSLYLKETENIHRACCNWCSSDFDTGSRGFLSIKDHSAKNKHCWVSDFYYFEFNKEMEIQVANMKQGQNLGQAVFGGCATASGNQDQAQDEEAVDDMDVVTIDDQQPSQGQSQPSQEQTQTQRVRTVYPVFVSMDSSRNGFEQRKLSLIVLH